MFIENTLVLTRKASLEDVTILLELTNQLGYNIAQSTLLENIKSYLQDSDRSLFVATTEETVIGYIALDIATTFHREGSHMRIVTLVIDQRHRGKGVGTVLLQVAENLAKERMCWVIELTSASHRKESGTHDFYETRGYLKNGSQAYFRKLMNT